MRGRTSNGAVIYLGPSAFNNKSVVAIATGFTRPSVNRKTGFMVQTWIMNAELPPLEAARRGLDASVCGTCPLRGNGMKDRSCYVTLHDGPTAVWKAWKSGSYPDIEEIGWSIFRGHAIRFGSYGDPAAVPSAIWFRLAKLGSRFTGYTHAWKSLEHQPLRRLLMASVETPDEAFAAWSAGWRSYRIRLPEEGLLPFEAVCPASKEAGYRTTCHACGGCDGARPQDLRQNVAVIAHGSGASAFRRARLAVIA